MYETKLTHTRIRRPKNTFTLLKVLAEAIATSYLEVAVET